MTVAKILVPIRGDGKGANVFSHAAAVARRFNSHIAALHSRPRPEDILPFGVPMPAAFREQMAASAREVADLEEGNLRKVFEEQASALGIEVVSVMPPPADRVTASWHEATGKQIETIRVHGRLADLVVVAKPDRDRNLGANTLKSALFSTGRPVLMCPDRTDAPVAVGDRLVIAWGGTTENARAVALAMDLIHAATEVTVLTIGTIDSGATAEELVAYLAIRGIKARLERVAVRGGVGATLLAESQSLGADLLVMGAYSHSHAHETLFGGATQHVVDHGAIPVVMVH